MTDSNHHVISSSTMNKLRAAVLGANDGIVSTASVVMGVAGATTDSRAIFTAGLAALVAGALSMAVGEYVSVSSQADAEKMNAKHQDDDDGEFTNPWAAAVASLIAFTLGGAIPFAAIVVAPDNRILVTVIAVTVALIATGYFSASVANASKLKSITRVVVGGLIAMAVTYFVGSLYGSVV